MLAYIQRKLIYLPFQAERIAAADAGLPEGAVLDISVTTDDGIDLHGWHFVARATDSQEKPGPTILYFPGNAAHRQWRVAECSVLTSLGADVFLFDYRGYGDNAGKPCEEAIAADVHCVWRYAVEQQRVQPQDIVLYGESIGGGVATRLAAELSSSGARPGGLITRSTFSTLADTGRHLYPWLPIRWFLVERYASTERIPKVGCPILMLHGDADEIVPIELGRRLFSAAPGTAASGFENRFVELSGADHNNVLSTHRAELHAAVGEFFATAGLVR